MKDREQISEQVRKRYALASEGLDERGRRQLVAAEALALGWGGVQLVSKATGVARGTITLGLKELRGQVAPPPVGKSRRPGGGRKAIVAKDPEVLVALERLVEPSTRGDPESPLRWTCKSVRKLAAELCARGHQVSQEWVRRTLQALRYRLHANRKTREGGDHPDRDAQFAHINATASAFLAAGDPVISVDAKKKELVGAFKIPGREWTPVGQPEEVRVYDFPIKGLGRVTPYGVYDLAANAGWVSVGVDHDTAAFAVATSEHWWIQTGRGRYPAARRLLITADGGGSNGSRTKLWKRELQRLADATGLVISVCHFPPGTSKWNKIEHRLFAFISQNWRARPLVSDAVVLSLIAATTTSTGLTVESYLDTASYPTGIEVTDVELATLRIQRETFHGEWNYTILPQAAEEAGALQE
ncbi:MAG TPA: ISAzo13 family transposase [Chloroflexota bacterium]